MCDLTARIANLEDASFSQARIGTMHLLEASAGTGKTYSIQTLYLRLILVEGLTVQQILVVTFTKDATKELRDRLQRILREALDYLNGMAENRDANDRTRKLVDVARGNLGKDSVSQRLQLALLDFDTAAIYTIHGFCQRVLNRFAFETRQPFDVEPAGDTAGEIEQLCKDWWRQNVYPMDERLAGFLCEGDGFSLGEITLLARKLISKPDARLSPEIEGGERIEHRMARLIRDFVRQNPGLPEESARFPGALPDVDEAIRTLQQQIGEFRDSVSSGAWEVALEALLAVTEFERTIPVPCQVGADALVAACKAFKTAVPEGTRAASFSLDASGCLSSPKCPELKPARTEAVRSAARALDLEARIRGYAPASLYRKKSFDSTRLLCGHFSGHAPCGAGDLYKAIKVVAEDGAGMADKVQLTVDRINPAFRELRGSLSAECGQAVCRAALEIRDRYRQGRPLAATASFDDYLVNLRDALNAGAEGGSGGLVDVLRAEFRAALIDEFQDTDPIQWGIFERLFRGAGVPCFLVGDPKQAIYRFRNGDVETYLKATRAIGAGARYPLARNHRSEKRLIDAVNQLFMDSEGRQTFGDGIEYRKPLEAAGKDKGKSLLVNGEPDPRPFKILLVGNGSGGKGVPGQHSGAARSAYKLTAEEIARLLRDGSLAIAGRRVRRKDIAVLVNKHQEGEYIARELAGLNIPAVRQGTGNVWETDDGRILWVVLEAVLDSRNLPGVRRALLSDWFGLTVDDIQVLNKDGRIPFGNGGKGAGHGMEDWVAFFDGLRETWLKRGFPAMFRELAGTLGLKERLLGLDVTQGQRRLANVNHLTELVERTILEGRKTPDGTLSWVSRQFDVDTADRGDEVKLRLETDDDAVRIMTIFTSKGLEFPIVFAPTLFMMQPRQYGGLYEYHEEATLRIARRADAGSDEAKRRERGEMEREHIRQIYVALTRAVHRTVVVALQDGEQEGKAKDGAEPKCRMKGVLGEVLRLPMKIERQGEGKRIVVDVEHVTGRFENIKGVACAVEVTEYTPRGVVLPLEAVQGEALVAPREKPGPDTSRGHGSFSSLAPREQKEAGKTAAGVEAEPRNRDGETAGQAAEQVERKPAGIFAFPSGARTGTCWHEIFEDLSFGADDRTIRERVGQKLRIHGFLKNRETGEERVDVTAQMVRNVVRTPLPVGSGAKPFSLSQVLDADRKTEWGFSFTALSGRRTDEVRDLVAGYGPYKGFIDALGDWDREIPGGYLTGFVDLLFRKDGRYSIVDWKSNRRGGRQADFGQAGLREEMALHSYWLQYLIYTVAVHQYLSRAMPAYNYERHFGGVYYIFLRGVDGKADAAGKPNGVFADRPPLRLVTELSGILGDFA